ncbi:hypothetical protein ANO11243_026510 [Dothideomycetidae sp. 11243]|nr:hypothetical protein ANO11243_026510 [fungal sp. No.11243]
MQCSCVRRLARHTSNTPNTADQFPSRNHNTIVRSLLRALLREASYLPDRNARSWIPQHITRRFKDNSLDKDARHAPLLESRWEAQLTQCRKTLLQLRTANIGDKNAIERVLHHTYARTGRRRRDLMAPLMKTQLPFSQTPLDEPTLSPLVLALLQSQMKHHPPEAARKNPKTMSGLKPDTGAKTIWMKPKREKALRKQVGVSRGALLDMLQVPLPDSEFAFLRQVSMDRTQVEAVPRPRARISGEYVADEFFLRRDSEGGLETKFRARHISRRFMQRRYALAFSQCPSVEYDKEREAWNVTWGSQILREAAVRRSTSAGMESLD